MHPGNLLRLLPEQRGSLPDSGGGRVALNFRLLGRVIRLLGKKLLNIDSLRVLWILWILLVTALGPPLVRFLLPR